MQLVELQRNLETLTNNNIKAFAVSYDSPEVLGEFADKFGITFPLLSDETSNVIRGFGILNTHIPDDHKWSGVPYPGTYMVGDDGLVFSKSFFAEHGTRESVNDMLQEDFQVQEMERGEVQVATSPDLTARAYFASPTIRNRQLNALTVEVSLPDGLHVNGRELPEGYVPIELSLEENENVRLHSVDYPEPEVIELPALDERLPVYTGRVEIKARCLGTMRTREEEVVQVTANLRYQACDDHQCFLPETLALPLTLRFLPGVPRD